MEQRSISYTNLKTKATELSASYHYIDFTTNYGVFVYDPNNDVLFDALPTGVDETDFETNIQPTATQHADYNALFKVLDGLLASIPKREVAGFTQHNTAFFRKSYKYDMAVNTTTEKEEKFTFDVWFSGGGYSVGDDVTNGDYIEFEVVDIDNLLGLGANNVLNRYIETEYVKANTEAMISGNSAVKIPAGVYLRTRYVSVSAGGQPVPIIIRYEMRR